MACLWTSGHRADVEAGPMAWCRLWESYYRMVAGNTDAAPTNRARANEPRRLIQKALKAG